jgi:hypothetical protein
MAKATKQWRTPEPPPRPFSVILEMTDLEARAVMEVLGHVAGTDARAEMIDGVIDVLLNTGISYQYDSVAEDGLIRFKS